MCDGTILHALATIYLLFLVLVIRKQNAWPYLSLSLPASLSFFLCVCACVLCFLCYDIWTPNRRPVSLLSVSPLRFPISQALGLQYACASAFRSSLVMSFNLNGFALVDDVNHSKKQTEPYRTEPKPIRFMHELSLIFFFYFSKSYAH